MKLARFTAWPAFILVFLIPFAAGVNSNTDLLKALFGFLAIFSFASFAFALNFYSDRDTDKYHDGSQKDFNLPRQPLITGEVTERECIVFCVVTFLLAIIFGFLVSNLFALLIVLACLFGGILYSHSWIRLKAKPLGDVFCISSLGVLVPSAGHLLSTGMLPDGLIMLILFLITATIYISTVVNDYKSDLKAGLRTSAVFFGQGRLMIAMAFVYLLVLAVAFLIVGESYPLGTKFFVILISAFPIIFFIAVARRWAKPTQMHMPTPASSPHWISNSPGMFSLSFIISFIFVLYAFFKISFYNYIPWNLSLWDPFLVY